MKYVFGPVPSRRLGQSLGIDPIPLKTCNWNCVYCQLGRSKPLINNRLNYFPPEEIAAEVRQFLGSSQPGEIDWITVVGSGEPLLHASIGVLIRQVKGMTDLPVAVITNGSLLYLPAVRQELKAADAVLPTLDAGTETLYRRISHSHHHHPPSHAAGRARTGALALVTGEGAEGACGSGSKRTSPGREALGSLVLERGIFTLRCQMLRIRTIIRHPAYILRRRICIKKFWYP